MKKGPPSSTSRRGPVIAALALAACVWASASSPARADANTERAAVLFKSGRASMVKGDAAAACPMFAESQRLDPSSGTLLNLALCEEALGKLASAAEHFTIVAAQTEARDERHAFAVQHIEALRPRLSRLRVDFTRASADATVSRDGVPLGASELGSPLYVDPGEHKVVVTSPSGGAPSTYTVVLGPGETKSLSVRASTSSPVAPAEPPPEHATSSVGRKLGVGLVAGGGVFLAGGIVTGLMALSDKSTVAKFCGPTSCTTQAGVDAASQGRVVAILSTVGFIGGLAALGGGVALIVGSPGKSASASITPQLSSAGGGLECAVAF